MPLSCIRLKGSYVSGDVCQEHGNAVSSSLAKRSDGIRAVRADSTATSGRSLAMQDVMAA